MCLSWLDIRNEIEKSFKITKNVSFLDFRAKIELLGNGAKFDLNLDFGAKFQWFCRIYETILEDFHTLWNVKFFLFRQFPSRHFAPFPQLQDFYLKLHFFSSFWSQWPSWYFSTYEWDYGSEKRHLSAKTPQFMAKANKYNPRELFWKC